MSQEPEWEPRAWYTCCSWIVFFGVLAVLVGLLFFIGALAWRPA